MKKKLLLTLFCLFCLFGVKAQETNGKDVKKELVKEAYDEFRPHWFLQLQGGVNYTVGEAKFNKLLSPAAAVSIGYKFSPLSAFRLNVNGWEAKGSWVYPRKYYKWNFVQADIDYLLDLANLFTGWKPNHFFNPYILIGAGANYCFNNDEAVALHDGKDINFKKLWTDSKILPNARAGVGADFRLSEVVSLNIEANSNFYTEKFNSKKGGNRDMIISGLVGLKINLGKTYTHHDEEYKYIPVEKPAPKKEVTPEPEKKQEPEKPVVKKVEPMDVNVFFVIGKSNIRDEYKAELDNLVNYLKDNKDALVVLTGYADKQTGNPAINSRLSKERALNVKKYLEDKGISSDRISYDYKGDTVQPFDTMEENRVTVCIASAQ